MGFKVVKEGIKETSDRKCYQKGSGRMTRTMDKVSSLYSRYHYVHKYTELNHLVKPCLHFPLLGHKYFLFQKINIVTKKKIQRLVCYDDDDDATVTNANGAISLRAPQ